MEGILEGERKEEDLIIKMLSGSRLFFLRMCRECEVFGTFRGLEKMKGGERKEEDLIVKIAVGSRTLLLGYADNVCIFNTFGD